MSTVRVTADSRFLRRVLMALVGLTLVTGAVAGFTTVEAIQAAPATCQGDCP